jgi:predicted HTH domain antitoxin
MASIVSLELLEEEIHALVQAGGYRSKEEALVHALEALLAANPHLRINTAVELFREGVVTLSRAAEIAGVEVESFKEKLAEKEVPIRVDESPEEVLAGAETISRLREAQ